MIVLGVTHPVARKQHRCDWCDRIIVAGERYHRERGIGDDGPYTFKFCAHCNTVAAAIWTRDPDVAHYDEGLDLREYLADHCHGKPLLHQFRTRWVGVSVEQIDMDAIPDLTRPVAGQAW